MTRARTGLPVGECFTDLIVYHTAFEKWKHADENSPLIVHEDPTTHSQMAGKTIPLALVIHIVITNYLARSGDENHDTGTGTSALKAIAILIPVSTPWASTNC